MTLLEATQQLTLDEFIQHYSQQPFELVNGEMRPLMPHVAVHQWIIRALFVLLYNYAVAKRLGEVLFELPTVELYDSTWVQGSRTPDILFFAAEKWDSYTASTADWLKKPALIMPDLAVEIMSPTDSYSHVQEKVEEYIAKGIRLIWVVDPQRKRVDVYAGSTLQRLSIGDVLTGGDVLPGLEIALTELFKGI